MMSPVGQPGERRVDSTGVGQLTAEFAPASPAHGVGPTVRTLTLAVPIAVIALQFDPVLRFGDAAVRLETVATAAVVFAALALAARIAGATAAEGDDPGPHVHRPRLRRDDLLFIVLGVVPGAVVGGRLGYGLTHLDYVAANPLALVDPAWGSAELGLAVVGGALSGGYVARLLDGPVGRWFHVAALPLLVALAGGKFADVLGGAGQGDPADVPWATAYEGPGPWASLAPQTPSHPAQVYEALATVAVLLVLAAVLAAGGFGRRDGRAFLVAVGLWALGRAAAGWFWRDPAVVPPFAATQLLAVAIAAGALLLVAGLPRRAASPERAPSEPVWPDPATRPRF